ncbi:hypothetical protein [Streptomyces sp. CA-106110]|uniref:hypothetical protein n=1 Tax=Streptomyces sp. CA-106110 TaxID=3240044 RepID=UPI003D902EDB
MPEATNTSFRRPQRGALRPSVTAADRAHLPDAIRGHLLTTNTTGPAALVAVYYTARNADTARRIYDVGQRTRALAQQGHAADRYTKAIEQPGSAELAARLGGIYALERIARDSARDHSTVVEVLTAFVRAAPPPRGCRSRLLDGPAVVGVRPAART